MNILDSLFSIIPMAIIILVIGIVSRKAREGKKKAQPEASPEPTDDVAENLNSPGSPAAEQIQPPKTVQAATRTLNNYRESRHPKETPSSPPAYHPPGARNRINGMSELKKAVVWAEILGKPKSLKSEF